MSFFSEVFIGLCPNKHKKRGYDHDSKYDAEICHFSISFPSKLRAAIRGTMVANIPITNIQCLSPEGFEICAITNAAKSILAMS